MDKNRLKINQIVNVYKDPISCTQLEGKAKLIEHTHPDYGDGLSIWIVRFQGEKDIYLRTVNAKYAFDKEQS